MVGFFLQFDGGRRWYESPVTLPALALVLRLVTSLPDCVPACALEPGEELVRLGVGTQKVVTVEGDWSGTVFSGAIEVKVLSRTQLLIIGADSGRGDLRVFFPKGERRFVAKVTKLDPDSCGISELWKRLPCGGDFDFDVSTGQVRIHGTYRSYEDLLTLLQLAASVPGAQIPPPPAVLVDRAFSEVNLALFRAGLEVRVRCEGKAAALHVDRPQPPDVLQRATDLVARHGELDQLCALRSQ